MEALALRAALTRFNIIVMPYFLCGLMDVCSGVLRGMGKAIVSTAISLVGACLLRVVWLWTVFPKSQTLETIFVSYPITWIVTNIAAFIVIQVSLRKILRAKREKEQAETAEQSDEATI